MKRRLFSLAVFLCLLCACAPAPAPSYTLAELPAYAGEPYVVLEAQDLDRAAEELPEEASLEALPEL